MDKFANNIYTLCSDVIPYTWALVIAALLITGVCMIIPSESTHQKAIKALPFIIIGSIVVLGSVYIGKYITGKISF